MTFRRSMGCNCCTSSCILYSDFDLPSSFASQWTEETGSWTWSGGTGILTADSDGSRLISTASNLLSGQGVHYVSVDIMGAGTVQIIVDWADSDNYTYAEVDTDAAYFKLFRVSGGTTTQYGITLDLPPIDQDPESVPYTVNVSVCRQATNVIAIIDADGQGFPNYSPMTTARPRFQEAVPHNNGGKVGVAVISGSANIELFDFYWTFEKTVQGNVECKSCFGCFHCNHNETTPQTVKVVLSGTAPFPKIGSNCSVAGCAAWLGTHFLNLGSIDFGIQRDCHYYKVVDLSSYCSGGYTPGSLQFGRSGADPYIAEVTAEYGNVSWQKSFGLTRPDCAFTDQTFSFLGGSGGECIWFGGIVCTVTY